MTEKAVGEERPQEPQPETVIATKGSGESESMMKKDDNSPKPMDQDVAGPCINWASTGSPTVVYSPITRQASPREQAKDGLVHTEDKGDPAP